MNNQNIFDNDTFFEGYKALRENDVNYNDLLEQPAMAKLLPDLNNKTILDLGCGYGHNCVDFVKRGAKRVVGIDISEKMLEVAKTESALSEIEYLHMSMTDISKLSEKFDFIYSSLAFHYVDDFNAFAKDMATMLNNGGYLLFSQEHPIITATVNGEGHFNRDENGNRISYTFSNYNEPGERRIHWYVDGVVKYHRTFGNIINALADAGFCTEYIGEPTPEEWAIEKLPSIVKEYIKPCFLIVKAKKSEVCFMKIMTFNVQHFLDYKNQIIDIKLFANAIKKYNPDFCGLNEVRGEGDIDGYTDQTNAIADAVGYNRYFADAILVDSTSPYGNAFICKYPIKYAEKILIPDPDIKNDDEHYETRCVAKAIIEIDGKEICFLVTHMGLAKDERANAVKTLCNIIDGENLPIILMGDFNTTPDDKVLTPLFDSLTNVDTYAPTFPSDNPKTKIDYIFYRGLECIKAETINEIYSDHLPIIAEFR